MKMKHMASPAIFIVHVSDTGMHEIINATAEVHVTTVY